MRTERVIKLITLLLFLGLGAASLQHQCMAAELKPLATSTDRLTVVELFTSQGCSSCPPADLVLSSLSERPGILALSWPVDYWDRMGWRDTFGSADHSRRQRSYNRRIGRTGVYTPQLFVDGTHQAVGSRRDEINAGLKASAAAGYLSIAPVLIAGGKTLTIKLPAISLDGPVVVDFVWFLTDATVTVNAGENRGRQLHYTNVVRRSEQRTDWQGEAKDLTISLSTLREAEADGFAILIHQDGRDGKIIGASYMVFEDTEAVAIDDGLVKSGR